MTNILILGTTGMLGSMVELYFKKHTDYVVFQTQRNYDGGDDSCYSFDATTDLDLLENILVSNNIGYIINCIGIIKPYCKDNDQLGRLNAIKINALFPHELARIAKKTGAKVIQIATDCVYSGDKGNYTESAIHDAIDVYGSTKSLGEVCEGEFLNLRCSIIGPERKGKVSLLEWILGQPKGETINGFTHHVWNGLTTLQFAKICYRIIDDGIFLSLIERSNMWHCIINESINKYDLVQLVVEIFEKDVQVNKINNIGAPINRTLSSERKDWDFQSPVIKMAEALNELKEFMIADDFYG